MSPNSFPGKLGIVQRVIPEYRKEFFDLLAESCEGGLSLFAGDVPPQESITPISGLQNATYVRSRNFHFLQTRSEFYVLWQSGLIDWLEKWNPDVLIIEANPRYISSYGAIKWMHARGRSVLGWGLGAPLPEKSNSVTGRIASRARISLRQMLNNQLDGYIAYSHKGANEYRQLSSTKKPVYVASNSVARQPQAPAIIRPGEFKGSPVVLYVGRIQKRKKLDNLLRAASILPRDLEPTIWIVGDGPEKPELEEYASSIYTKTKFFGMKKGDELAEIFRQADLFVLPGTGGLAVQEAMSFALPVIVAEGDGTQGDLVRNDNGWVIPSDDVAALSEALQSALSNPGRLREMGNRSFYIVKSEINIEKMVESFIHAINQTYLGSRS